MIADLPSPEKDMLYRRIGYPLEPRPQRPLPRYTDWIRGTSGELWCEVLSIHPDLNLRWRYTDHQVDTMLPWRCESVWLHAAWLPNWRLLQGPETDILADLEEAVNTLVGDPEITRYTLLVSPDGLFYDTNRLGGDHHIRTKSGRRFILSVRRGVRNDDKILLAIAY